MMVTTTSKLLSQRVRDVGGMSLSEMLRQAPALKTMSPQLASCFESWSPTAREDTAEWSQQLAAGMMRYLTSQFQYLDIARAPIPLLNLYELFTEEFFQARGSVRAATLALANHHERLHEWIVERLTEASAIEPVLHGFRPVCAEYEPETQLAILGLRLGCIDAPVLDLGCGDGRLVRHLRAAGIEAIGVDQNATGDQLRADWFGAPLQPGRWGTIVAHQSVSLHFRHAHLHWSGRASRYAALFMRIIDSLKPGGVFAYAPSVPFFEKLLTHRGTIERHEGAPHALATKFKVGR